MLTPKVADLLKRGAISILYVLGITLAAYNILAFKSDKFGLYFVDNNQLWFSLGLGLVAVGWTVRNWNKL